MAIYVFTAKETRSFRKKIKCTDSLKSSVLLIKLSKLKTKTVYKGTCIHFRNEIHKTKVVNLFLP